MSHSFDEENVSAPLIPEASASTSEPSLSSLSMQSKPSMILMCVCVLAAFTSGVTIVLQTALSVVLADRTAVRWNFSSLIFLSLQSI